MWYILILFVLLLLAELVYFKIAAHYNIIDRPNQRSSHSAIAFRGGGIIFIIALWIWMSVCQVTGLGQGCFASLPTTYWWFLIAVTLVGGVSFLDDVKSLPVIVRLIAQFIAMGLLNIQLFSLFPDSVLLSGPWWTCLLFVGISLVVCVGASNIINFMDGINGITGAYAMASLVPLYLLNEGHVVGYEDTTSFVEPTLIITIFLADVVFCLFNFRPKGKAKCFAGDVGSIGVAYILLFLIGSLIVKTGDVTYLVFLIVYGVDGCLTIVHRIMLHENLGEAHRKHAFQLMANELHIGHVKVASFYTLLQLVISLGFLYLSPLVADSLGVSVELIHWGYLFFIIVLLSVAYICFMKKNYHLHEAYLASLEEQVPN